MKPTTPSASAGPQAEVIAWRWRYCRDEEIGRWIYNDDKPDLDCTKAMVELEALALAHPQPQQADGRGAVIEALIQRHASAYVARGAAISDSIIAECKASREALLAALQQSDGPAK